MIQFTFSIHSLEVVRELTHECSERGIVVEKIWRTFVELFERVLRDVRGLLALHKRKTQDLTEALEGSKVELERLKSKYPEWYLLILGGVVGRYQLVLG